MEMDGQQVCPGGQVSPARQTHLPNRQAAGHTLPQLPQLLGSAQKSAQAPLQQPPFHGQQTPSQQCGRLWSQQLCPWAPLQRLVSSRQSCTTVMQFPSRQML